ncbi:helix-turn-helix domain-containing protein [Ruthenibacterium lactatiformans]|uniref:Helix-turn-helix domain-containing protein n=1 Tax=Ruthenibacterium lactatiformans TaxID=1550024 RepID=A0A6L6LSF6_9FIRM|nr:helix-turn-helix domain-containing protein [Subdoligranulum sp.]MTQ79987.1 helix-turn-helix domain-containing protein [Ruthenibacterium lactatiformans]MTS21228.1 helix-turn-helix domain-containing protein [Ruthenibacterium lactatiformans]MTS26664.1 helix-turn-helix domain-containing protein [Ruthenibacterium lactatiformans]MTS30886.1 helix-turn-helix domain-containing protein [Ruthenibacterium lactatiformans]
MENDGERKKVQHLQMEERGAIRVLKKQWPGARAIARKIGCIPSAVTNELRRGTPKRKIDRGRTLGYSAQRGEAVYEANLQACHIYLQK